MNEELNHRAETMAARWDGHLPETARLIRDLLAECERLSAECLEQARLNGMGGERELRLHARIAELTKGASHE